MSITAKEELLLDLDKVFLERYQPRDNYPNQLILCSAIHATVEYPEHEAHIFLKVGYSADDLDKFFEDLDFEYSMPNELIGEVWFTDGSYLTRRSHYNESWWELIVPKQIPVQCRVCK